MNKFLVINKKFESNQNQMNKNNKTIDDLKKVNFLNR